MVYHIILNISYWLHPKCPRYRPGVAQDEACKGWSTVILSDHHRQKTVIPSVLVLLMRKNSVERQDWFPQFLFSWWKRIQLRDKTDSLSSCSLDEKEFSWETRSSFKEQEFYWAKQTCAPEREKRNLTPPHDEEVALLLQGGKSRLFCVIWRQVDWQL